MAIQKRNSITSVILSFVTCGIYYLYWAYCLSKETASIKDPNDNGLIEFLLTWFLAPVGLYLMEKKFAEGCAAKGIEHKDNTIIYLVLGFFLPPVALYMMQEEMNKLAA